MGNRTPTYPGKFPLERCVISSPRYIGKARAICDRQRWRDRDEPSLHGRFCARHVMAFASQLTTLSKGYHISIPTKQLIHRLSEVGHLYIRVDRFIREREARSGIGMIEQSLCHHLQSQLTEYYRLIAVLESQLNIASNVQDEHARASLSVEPDPRAEESGLTLKRLDVWVNEWRLRMRMMSVCVEATKGTV
jgi:hypothetical protein